MLRVELDDETYGDKMDDTLVNHSIDVDRDVLYLVGIVHSHRQKAIALAVCAT